MNTKSVQIRFWSFRLTRILDAFSVRVFEHEKRPDQVLVVSPCSDSGRFFGSNFSTRKPSRSGSGRLFFPVRMFERNLFPDAHKRILAGFAILTCPCGKDLRNVIVSGCAFQPPASCLLHLLTTVACLYRFPLPSALLPSKDSERITIAKHPNSESMRNEGTDAAAFAPVSVSVMA